MAVLTCLCFLNCDASGGCFSWLQCCCKPDVDVSRPLLVGPPEDVAPNPSCPICLDNFEGWTDGDGKDLKPVQLQCNCKSNIHHSCLIRQFTEQVGEKRKNCPNCNDRAFISEPKDSELRKAWNHVRSDSDKNYEIALNAGAADGDDDAEGLLALQCRIENDIAQQRLAQQNALLGVGQDPQTPRDDALLHLAMAQSLWDITNPHGVTGRRLQNLP